MKFETRNCTPPKAIPHTSAAGRTPFSAFHPPITMIRYAGTINEIGAQMRPTPALRRSIGKPVIAVSVTIGVPMEPNATGAVLASKQIPAA